ncbi:MAG: hypothetical protein IPP00_11445 [Actinomycetales bacterium]|uniref:Uncharacterized protein n=1 Tax=Candidatus Phosphoribacter hodrii TaxID=2953743 RepID=A0A9D7T8G6_9MICO|nr:hypothetical protein [Candidatus Phosphoribacter hodrii]
MSHSGEPALAAAPPVTGPAGMPSEPVAAPKGSPSTTFRLGALAILVVTLVWRAWTVSAWSWIQDDWIYQIEAQRMPLGDYLTQNYNQHFMPGQFLLAWASTTLAPLDYTWAVVVTVGLSVLSVLAWALALAEVFGENSRALLALALVALSPIFLPTSLWWAASIQVLPLQLAMALVILFLCRYLRRPGPRPLIGLGVSYALGLFFWQKALLLVIPAFFLVLLLGSGSTRARLRAAWRPLGLLATLTVLYLPAYLLVLAKPGSAGMGVDRTFSPRGLGESLSFFFTGLFNIVLPSLVGGPWGAADNTTSIYDPVPAVLWLPMLALAVCGAILVVRFRHRGGWLIAMVLTYAVVSWGLVLFSSRYQSIGVLSVREARYSADLLPVAFFALTFAFTRSRIEVTTGTPAVRRPLPQPLAGRVDALVGVLTLAVSLSALAGNGAEWQRIEPHSPRPWVDTIIGDATAVGPRSVYNSVAPDSVIHPGFFPTYAHLNVMLAPLGLPLTFDAPARQVLIARGDGHLVNAAVEDLVQVPTGPVSDCGYLVKPGETAYVPVTNRLFAWTWFVQIDYFSERGGDAVLRADTKSWTVHLEPGLNQVQLPIVDSVSALAVTGAADAGASCVTKIQVGNIRETSVLAVP